MTNNVLSKEKRQSQKAFKQLGSYKLSRAAKVNRIIGKIFIYLVLIIFVAWILAPFSVVLVTSFKTWQEAADPEFSFFPKEFTAEGYKQVFTYKSSSDDALPVVFKGFLNTLMIVIPSTLFGLFFSAMSAYAFAKLRFKGKKTLFTILLATMMIPGTIMLTPSYAIYNVIGWINTPLPLIIPGAFGAATCVFFMRQFYMGIPTELIEAGKLDGMGYFRIFWKIMVPLSVPALFAQGLLGFIGGYNDYLGPYLYLQDDKWTTLQLALTLFQGAYSSETPTIMAGAIIALIPTLIIYIVAQKYFIEGIATTGMKL